MWFNNRWLIGEKYRIKCTSTVEQPSKRTQKFQQLTSRKGVGSLQVKVQIWLAIGWWVFDQQASS